MTHGHSNEHLSGETLQALLDRDLSAREGARAEEHLAACARCSAELEAWRALLTDLDGLPPLRPEAGFGGRVLARLGAERALGEAVSHLPGAALQEYLDGRLGRRESARVEAHLAACAPCASEAGAWTALLGRLDALDRLDASPGFAERVLAALPATARQPLAARIRARVAALLPGRAMGHLDAPSLQDLVDGALTRPARARARAHVEGCAACAAEATAWRSLADRRAALPRFAPSTGFADRVVARLRRPAAIAARAAAPARPGWARALAHARRLVPRSRRAWAAISGVAVTPAAVGGLVLYVVFSHPTLTPSALASFLWWQVGDLAAAAWSALAGAALQSAELFGLYSIFEALASAPFVVAAGVLAYALVSALALRVLYRNMIPHRPLDRRYVSAS